MTHWPQLKHAHALTISISLCVYRCCHVCRWFSAVVTISNGLYRDVVEQLNGSSWLLKEATCHGNTELQGIQVQHNSLQLSAKLWLSYISAFSSHLRCYCHPCSGRYYCTAQPSDSVQTCRSLLIWTKYLASCSKCKANLHDNFCLSTSLHNISINSHFWCVSFLCYKWQYNRCMSFSIIARPPTPRYATVAVIVRPPSRRHISTTKQDRPIVTMEHS